MYRKRMGVFKSHGIALWDLAIANLVYRRAISKGVGKEIPFRGYVDEKMITPML